MSKIYMITNDINDKVYIGKTEFSIEKRFREHCSDFSRPSLEKRPLYNAMKKYGIEHFSIKELEECSSQDAPLREQYWIGYYHSYTDGYNATLGGDGKCYIDSDAIWELWSEGKTLKEIVFITGHDIEMISAKLKMKGVSGEEIKKRGIDTFSKRILMLNKQTEEIIRDFSSTREAARFLIQELGKSSKAEGGYSTHISEVCRGIRKSCLGYKWRYADT